MRWCWSGDTVNEKLQEAWVLQGGVSNSKVYIIKYTNVLVTLSTIVTWNCYRNICIFFRGQYRKKKKSTLGPPKAPKLYKHETRVAQKAAEGLGGGAISPLAGP